MFRSLLLASASIASAQQAFGAEPKDLAELFPAGTLAYAEIGQPAATSDAIAEFVKGTLLADNLAHSHDRRDKMQPPGALAGLKRVGERSALVSPEILADFKKFKGVAAGLTGFDSKTGRPSLAVAFVLGESQLAGFLVRQYLLSAANIRRVGKIEGIGVYQNRGLTGAIIDENNKPEPIFDPAPAQGTGEPTYFYIPGLFVIGSSVNAVRDVYRRFAGTEKSAGFSTAPVLKPHGEARKKPGLFFCIDAAALDSQLIAAKKVSNVDWQKSPAISYVRFLLNPKQVESVAGSIQLLPDGWNLAVSADVKAGGTSPLLALLSGGAATAEDGRGVPADSQGAFTLAFPAKEKRAKAILDVADAIGSAMGITGALPSELAAEAEKSGFKLGGEFLPMVQSMTVFVPKVADGKMPAEPKPLVMLTLDDEASAKAWLAVLPRLSQTVSGAEKLAEPASEVLQGIKVWGLVHPPSTPFHYAIVGTRIVAGRDRDAVAGAAKQAANPWLKSERPSSFDGVLSFAAATERLSTIHAQDGIRPSNESRADFQRQNPDGGEGFAKMKLELKKSTAAMPPIRLRAGGAGRTLKIQLEQRDLKKPLAKLLEALWQLIELSPVQSPGELFPDGYLRGRSARTSDSIIAKYH